jgi:hypothetical protein
VVRDVATGIVVSMAGALPGLALWAMHEGRRALLHGTALGAAGGVMLGMAVNVLDARRGRRLVAVAGAIASLTASLAPRERIGATGLFDGTLVHGGWIAAVLLFPRAYRWLWGMRARNGFLRRRWDPVDPLGA